MSWVMGSYLFLKSESKHFIIDKFSCSFAFFYIICSNTEWQSTTLYIVAGVNGLHRTYLPEYMCYLDETFCPTCFWSHFYGINKMLHVQFKNTHQYQSSSTWKDSSQLSHHVSMQCLSAEPKYGIILTPILECIQHQWWPRVKWKSVPNSQANTNTGKRIIAN